MKWPDLKPKEVRFVAATLLVVFVFLNYWFMIPWWNKEHELAEELNIKQMELEAQDTQYIKNTKRWRQEYFEITKDRDSTSPHVKDSDAWKKHIDDLASQSGLASPNGPGLSVLREVNPRGNERIAPSGKTIMKNKPNDRPDELRLECVGDGSIQQAVKFLYFLQTDPAYPRIEKCQVSPSSSSGGQKLPHENKLKITLIVMVKLKPNP